MNRRQMLLRSGAACLGTTVVGAAAPSQGTDNTPPPRRLLIFTRSVGYEHDVVRRCGQRFSLVESSLSEWASSAQIDVVCTKDGSVFDEDVDRFGAFAFFTAGDPTKPDAQGTRPMTLHGKRRLLDAVASGAGFLGFHSAADTFHSPGPRTRRQRQPDPYIAMLGGEYVAHGPQQDSVLSNTEPTFPGLQTWNHHETLREEFYTLKNFAPDLRVLLEQQTDGMSGHCYRRAPYPATWVRRHGRGRVFYTSLGHRPATWSDPRFAGLVLGGLRWAFDGVS